MTIEGLAADAEVSKQTIYRWWPTKAAILGEALLEGSLPDSEVPVPMTADLGADLRTWFSVMSAALAQRESLTLARALIEVTAANPELGLLLNERLAAPIREWVVERMSRGQAAGDVRADVDAAAIADQFIAMGSYFALIGRTLSAEQLDEMVLRLLKGIAAA